MSTRFADHMSDADALMWNIEKDPVLRSTIVAVGLLDRAPDFERLRRRLDRASIAIPRLRQRVLSPPLRLAPPRWAHELNFDLDYHLRRVRIVKPGDHRQLLELVAPTAQSSFDRARPLWELTIVEGLAGNHAAAVMKVHHSVTDGVGGIDLLSEIVDLERDAEEPAPLPPPEAASLSSRALLRDSLQHSARRGLGISRRVPAMVSQALVETARDPLRAAASALDTGRSIARMLAPATAPMSTVLGARGLGRRLDTLDVPLDDLKRAAKSVNGSVNDAFVAAVVGGLTRYHSLHGAAISELRMTLPINLRTSAHDSGGNQFAPARFPVPASIHDPAQRMRAIGALVRGWRDEPALRMTSTLAGMLNRLPTATTTALFGSMLKCVDFVTSNVPGAPIPVFLAGAGVDAFYAFAPPSGAALNVTLVSHCDRCCIGIVTDTAAVADPDALVESLHAGFDEVERVGMSGQDAPVGRRVFLGLIGFGVAGVLVGARVDDWLERVVGPVEARDPTGLLSLLPIGRFRIYSVSATLPSRSHADYRLKIGGLVEHPQTLTYAQIRARPATSLTRDFQCVTGWRVHGVHWVGLRLRDLLDDAGVKPEATAVRFTSFDGVYSESLTLEQARRDDVLVAYRLDGSDLSRLHGGPVRLAVTPMYGYKSLKWLDTIELTAEVEKGYWEHRGYDVNGWVGHSNGRSDDPTAYMDTVTPPAELERFDLVERIVHWTTAALVGVLIATGACLYLGQLEALVGRRDLVRNIHVAAGLSLPVPLLLGLVTRAGRGLRRDLRRLNRWSVDDRRWWRVNERARVQLGKFNPGQKLNATFLGGALVVMMMSGSIMRFFSPFPDSWRTGATSVHDWFALGIGISVIGHIMFATRDPVAMRAMSSGPVPEAWARRHRPRWHAEVVGPTNDPGASEPDR